MCLTKLCVKENVGYKKNVVQQIVWSKIILGNKKCGHKVKHFVWVKNNYGQKNIRSNKMFCQEFFGSNNNCNSKKFRVQIFVMPTCFGFKQNFGQKLSVPFIVGPKFWFKEGGGAEVRGLKKTKVI